MHRGCTRDDAKDDRVLFGASVALTCHRTPAVYLRITENKEFVLGVAGLFLAGRGGVAHQLCHQSHPVHVHLGYQTIPFSVEDNCWSKMITSGSAGTYTGDTRPPNSHLNNIFYFILNGTF